MTHVDYLNRNGTSPPKQIMLVTRIPADSADKPKTIREYQSEDVFCQNIVNQLHREEGYSVKVNLVFLQNSNDGRERCFVPIAARLEIMRLYHDESSHIGADKMLMKLQEDLIWPRMGKTVR